MRAPAFLCILLGAAMVAAVAAPADYIIILDASNSMNKVMTGAKSKFAWAQEALVELVKGMPEETRFGVVVFGHRVSRYDKPKSCQDLELLTAFGTHGSKERDALINAVLSLQAGGLTPLSEALRFAASHAPQGTEIILLTDGEETCDGDPIGTASALCGQGYIVHVVGVALEPQARETLRTLAGRCQGKFVEAADPADLISLLGKVVAPKIPKIPDCLSRYRVDPKIVALLVENLPYAPCTDPMWPVILGFLEAAAPVKVIVGTAADDSLFGTPGNDLILGLGGNDRIYGLAGNDLLIGGAGDDLIQGGEGCDLILGGPGNDLLFGGPGDDIIYGEDGDDRIEGEAGNDRLYGGPCGDILLGGPGCNHIDGGPGQNFIYDEGTCAPLPSPTCTGAVLPSAPPTCLPAGIKTVEEGKSIDLIADVYDPDGDRVKVSWSAPKGSFSDPCSLKTTYYAPWVTACDGEYVTVTVVAEDCCGGRSQDEILIHVLNVNTPPLADAGPDLVIDEGGKVRLSAWACDPDGDPLTYKWIVSCGRGTLDNPTVLQPTYTAPLTSSCTGEVVELVLVVRDACGAEARDTVQIHVRNLNKAPWADAGPDLDVFECGQVLISGRAGDPDGDPLNVFWTVTAGKLIGADTLCPVFVAPEVSGCEGIQVVATLRVVDPCGAMAEDQVVIRVLNVNRPPSVKADP